VRSHDAEASSLLSALGPTYLSQSRIARFGQGDVLVGGRSSNIDVFVVNVSVDESWKDCGGEVLSSEEIFHMFSSASRISGENLNWTDIKLQLAVAVGDGSSVRANFSILSRLEIRRVAPPNVSFGADPRPASGT
jgi:hypothetical protein